MGAEEDVIEIVGCGSRSKNLLNENLYFFSDLPAAVFIVPLSSTRNQSNQSDEEMAVIGIHCRM